MNDLDYEATNQAGWEVQAWWPVEGWQNTNCDLIYTTREAAVAAMAGAEWIGVPLRVYPALHVKGRLV